MRYGDGANPEVELMADRGATAHAERRQITVAFVDLAGSTELSGRLDPEDFRDLILAYQEAVSRVVCLLYTSPSPRDQRGSRMPSSA